MNRRMPAFQSPLMMTWCVPSKVTAAPFKQLAMPAGTVMCAQLVSGVPGALWASGTVPIALGQP
jgi:hypothetical protein